MFLGGYQSPSSGAAWGTHPRFGVLSYVARLGPQPGQWLQHADDFPERCTPCAAQQADCGLGSASTVPGCGLSQSPMDRELVVVVVLMAGTGAATAFQAFVSRHHLGHVRLQARVVAC